MKTTKFHNFFRLIYAKIPLKKGKKKNMPAKHDSKSKEDPYHASVPFHGFGHVINVTEKSQSWPTIAGINHTQSLALRGRARDQ